MGKYAAYTIKEFPEDIMASVVTPAADHLFNVSKTSVRLEEVEVRAFHRATMRLLFLCKRSRPEIQTVLAFLTTRIKEPMDKDGKKLARLLAYLKVTPEDF